MHLYSWAEAMSRAIRSLSRGYVACSYVYGSGAVAPLHFIETHSLTRYTCRATQLNPSHLSCNSGHDVEV